MLGVLGAEDLRLRGVRPLQKTFGAVPGIFGIKQKPIKPKPHSLLGFKHLQIFGL